MSGKRHKYSAALEAKLVIQVLSGEKATSELCQPHKLTATALNRCRTECIEYASNIFEPGSRGKENR